jgi:hypothetical protein
MYTSKIRPAIEKYLEDRPDEAAFLRSEFNGLGKTRSGVDKALRAMVKDGKLVRVGYGIYVRSERRVSSITGEVITAKVAPPELWTPQVLRKLGVTVGPSQAMREYNERQTTQVPARYAYDVGNSRIRRRILIGKVPVRYERA